MTLAIGDIKDYIELYGCPTDVDIFYDSIFMLDNDFIDEQRKKSSK